MIAPRTKLLVLVGALACLGAAVNRLELPVAKVTVRVVDESGSPVGGATVTLGFRDRFSAKDVFTVGTTARDRNLEWDPKRNLIPGLKFQETPREP